MSDEDFRAPARSRRGWPDAILSAIGAGAVLVGASSRPIGWEGLPIACGGAFLLGVVGLAWAGRRIVEKLRPRKPLPPRDGPVSRFAWPVAAAVALSAMSTDWPFAARVLLSAPALRDRIEKNWGFAKGPTRTDGQWIGLLWVEAVGGFPHAPEFLLDSSGQTWLDYRPGPPPAAVDWDGTENRHVVGPWWIRDRSRFHGG